MAFPTSRGVALVHEGCFFGTLRWAYPKAHKHDVAKAAAQKKAAGNGGQTKPDARPKIIDLKKMHEEVSRGLKPPPPGAILPHPEEPKDAT